MDTKKPRAYAWGFLLMRSMFCNIEQLFHHFPVEPLFWALYNS